MDELSQLYDKVVQNDLLWISQVFVVVFITLVCSSITIRVLKHLLVHTDKTRNLWDDTLLESAILPVKSLIWLLGFGVAANIVNNATEQSILTVADTIVRVGVVLHFTWFLVRLIKNGEKNFLTPSSSKSSDPTTVMAIGKLLRITIIVTSALVLLQSLGYSISGVLAFGGVGGIAVGFAAKDLLANFFGGLMIYMDRPFKVGDWIRSPDQEIEGTVEEIGLRLTRIRTFDKRPLYIPNQTFTQISVENPSRMSNRRIYETIGLRYEDAGKMVGIVADVKSMLSSHESIDAEQTLIVNFVAFADSSLNFFVYTFTKTTDWIEFHEIKQNVLLEILNIVERNGAEFAFPTQTLHVPEVINIAAIEGLPSA